jgi:hypothetical protein
VTSVCMCMCMRMRMRMCMRMRMRMRVRMRICMCMGMCICMCMYMRMRMCAHPSLIVHLRLMLLLSPCAGRDPVLLSHAQASKAAIPSAADAAAAPAASNPAKSPRRKSIGGSATTMAATTAFERKRAFGGIYSHSAEDADEAKFVTDSFAIYASTNALYPVRCRGFPLTT